MTNTNATRTLQAAIVASAAHRRRASRRAASSPARINAFLINEIGFGKQPYVALTTFTKTPSTLTGLTSAVVAGWRREISSAASTWRSQPAAAQAHKRRRTVRNYRAGLLSGDSSTRFAPQNPRR
jgi:hypothetical protein